MATHSLYIITVMKYNCIWDMAAAVHRLQAQMDMAMQPLCAKHDITPLQLRVLMAVDRHGQLTGRQLAKAVGMAPGNSSVVCKRLAAAGLLTRERDPQNGRQVTIRLTKRGEALVAHFKQCFLKKCHAVGLLEKPCNPAPRDEAHIAGLAAALDEMSEHLEQYNIKTAGSTEEMMPQGEHV